MSAPRVHLVPLPPWLAATLELPPPRAATALAAAALPHLHAVAASERVVDDARKRPQARDNPRFGFAAGSLPYLIAADEPHPIAAALAEIRRLPPGSLEPFFVAQAERLGTAVRKLDRSIALPAPAAIEAWMRERVEQIQAARQPSWLGRLIGAGPDATTTARAGAALAELVGRLGPVWSEGRGRWLGVLLEASPPTPGHDAAVLAGLPVDPPEVRRAFGVPEPDAPIAAALRTLLAPSRLPVPAGAVSIPVEALEPLGRIVGGRWDELAPHAARWFLSTELDDWRVLLLAALHDAAATGVPLLETTGVLRWGYRWPLF